MRQCQLVFSFFVIPLRFERRTHALEGRCSIQLSYGTILFYISAWTHALEGRCSIQLSYGTILNCGAKVDVIF